jgi:hypothetical protein
MTPQPNEALANLRDIHLPEAVSAWPPAPGWWIAIGLVIATAILARQWLLARRRSVRRAALRELADIEAGIEGGSDIPLLATRLSTLLRRVAVARYPRRDVASLHGEEWKQFLVEHGQGSELDEEIIHELATAVYAAPRAEAIPSDAWSRAVGGWIRGNT